MDAHVEQLLRRAMRNEGWRDGDAALVDHPADRGGLTRGGVTARSWGRYKGLDRPATADELRAITEADALAFYFRVYVVEPGFGAVPDARLQALLVDWAFTSGPDDPTLALQASLRRRGHYVGKLDGAFGPKTRAAALADRAPRTTYRDVFVARVKFYVSLALADPEVRAFMATHPATQLHNLRGWENRALDYTP